MNPYRSLQIDPTEMRQLAQQTVDLILERLEKLDTHTAWDGEFRMELHERFNEEPPEEGQSAQQVIEQAATQVLPLSLSLDHPRCFGFVPTAPTWPSILTEFLTAGFNINNAVWLISSGPSAIELLVTRWFCDWAGYPEQAGGIMTNGGSTAAIDAFVAARECAENPDRPTVYMSNQSHSAQIRAAKIIGIPPNQIRMIQCDSEFRLEADVLAQTIETDLTKGFQPLIVAANAGTTSSGAIDPLHEIAAVCEKHDIWYHVDAAYGGFAVLTELGARLLDGMSRADSISIDAHKWFFQPYEAGCLLVRDCSTLERTFQVPHDVLQDAIWGADHPNFCDRGSQLSRSVRALKIWVSVKTFGLRLFREAISRAMQLARRAEEFVNESELLESLAPVTLSIVCFRINPVNSTLSETDLNQLNFKILSHIFWDDQAFLSSTNLNGKVTLRMCVVNYTTTWEDIEATLNSIERFVRQELGKV